MPSLKNTKTDMSKYAATCKVFNVKSVRDCICCKQPTANEYEHLCEECKDTIEFVKANKNIISDMINKFIQGESK